jgi:hypothetical protein
VKVYRERWGENSVAGLGVLLDLGGRKNFGRWVAMSTKREAVLNPQMGSIYGSLVMGDLISEYGDTGYSERECESWRYHGDHRQSN